MNDALIKGTGNSRYLKSVENFLALYPTYEAFAAALMAGTLPVDFNGINIAGWHQLGTALNKANLLSDMTASLFAGQNVSTPNDAFAALGKYAQHCWAEISNAAWIEYAEDRTDIAEYINITDTYPTEVQIAKSITVNQETQAVELVNPTDYTIQASGVTGESVNATLAQKYQAAMVPGYLKVGTTVYYFPPNSVFAYSNGSGVSADTVLFMQSAIQLNKFAAVKAQIVGTAPVSHADGSRSYVFSPDRSAYPDSGTVGDKTYLYMGVPFERLPGAIKIQTGSYVGTGTYGADNPNVLTFDADFTPQLVVIVSNENTDRTGGNIIIRGQTHSNGIGGYAAVSTDTVLGWTITWGEHSVEWYSSSEYAELQLNTSDTVYFYAAIGY